MASGQPGSLSVLHKTWELCSISYRERNGHFSCQTETVLRHLNKGVSLVHVLRKKKSGYVTKSGQLQLHFITFEKETTSIVTLTFFEQTSVSIFKFLSHILIFPFKQVLTFCWFCSIERDNKMQLFF